MPRLWDARTNMAADVVRELTKQEVWAEEINAKREEYARRLDENHEQRFLKKVDKSGPLWNGTHCWLWTSGLSTNGYGQFTLLGKTQVAHKISYCWAKGAVPMGLELDHLCRNPICVNPDHLEAVTRQTNQLRGNTIGARASQVTHCPQGHPYNLFNTIWRLPGGRKCRECNRRECQERRDKAVGHLHTWDDYHHRTEGHHDQGRNLWHDCQVCSICGQYYCDTKQEKHDARNQ